MPANMKAAGIKYKKGGSKRRTVKVNTVKPAPGMYGGSPTTTKTVTKKKRSGKTVTKTKSINNPLNPMAKSRVTKTKTVTRGSGPYKQTVSAKNSSKNVSQKRGYKMQDRMRSRKGATETTAGGRKRPFGPGPRPPRPRRTQPKMGMGGKAPMAEDYVGNPMQYFNDKAAYGRETAKKKMMQKQIK